MVQVVQVVQVVKMVKVVQVVSYDAGGLDGFRVMAADTEMHVT